MEDSDGRLAILPRAVCVTGGPSVRSLRSLLTASMRLIKSRALFDRCGAAVGSLAGLVRAGVAAVVSVGGSVAAEVLDSVSLGSLSSAVDDTLDGIFVVAGNFMCSSCCKSVAESSNKFLLLPNFFSQ